jgi:hypothetical protein
VAVRSHAHCPKGNEQRNPKKLFDKLNGGGDSTHSFKIGGTTIALVTGRKGGCQSEKSDKDQQLFQGVFFHFNLNFGYEKKYRFKNSVP